MKLVRLTTDISVEPSEVSHVHIERQGMTDPRYHHVAVSMKNGHTFQIEPQYNESLWAAHDRILDKLGEEE